MKSNMQKDRNTLAIRSILNYLDGIIPTEESVHKSRGSYVKKIMDPVLAAFIELEDNDVFAVVQETDTYHTQKFTQSEYVEWKFSCVTIVPENTAVEYNLRYMQEKENVKKKELKKLLKEQAKAVAAGAKQGEAEATLLLENLDVISNLLKVDPELLKKGVKSASKKSKQQYEKE